MVRAEGRRDGPWQGPGPPGPTAVRPSLVRETLDVQRRNDPTAHPPHEGEEVTMVTYQILRLIVYVPARPRSSRPEGQEGWTGGRGTRNCRTVEEGLEWAFPSSTSHPAPRPGSGSPRVGWERVTLEGYTHRDTYIKRHWETSAPVPQSPYSSNDDHGSTNCYTAVRLGPTESALGHQKSTSKDS